MVKLNIGEYYHIKIDRGYHKADAIIRIITITPDPGVRYEIVIGYDTDGFCTKTSGHTAGLFLDSNKMFKLVKEDIVKLDAKICEILYGGEIDEKSTKNY